METGKAFMSGQRRTTAMGLATAVAAAVAMVVAGPWTASAQGVTAGAGSAVESARGSGVVEGRVTLSRAGEDLGGVTVELVELRQRRLTDGRGRYAFTGVPAGTYTLRFHRLGLLLVDRTVAVGVGETRVVDMALGEEAIALEGVLVMLGRARMVGDAATARQIAGSAHVIDRAAMAEEKLAFDDVGGLLRRVPGVNVQEEEGYGQRPHIGMRGTGTERSTKVTVMEDGVLIAPAPYSAPAAYFFPAVGRMEAVEVRKGSSQVRYGPRTVGGALNLVTAGIPTAQRLEVEAAGGPAMTGKLSARAGDSYRHGGWLVETYQLRTDGFKALDSGGDTGFRLGNTMAKLRLNTDVQSTRAYQELELKLNRFDELANETYVGLTDADFRSTPLRRYAGTQRDRLEASQSQVQLRHFAQPTRWLDVTTVTYRNDVFRDWYKLQSVMGRGLSGVVERPEEHAAELAILRGADSGDDALRLRSNHREYYARGLQTTLGLRFRTGAVRHDVEMGVRWHEDQEDRFQQEDGYRMTAGRMVLTSEGAPGSQENRVGHASARAIFVQNHLTAGRFTFSPGVRNEAIDFTRTDYALGDATRAEPTNVRTNSVDVWIPGMGASVLLTPTARLFAGVHRGFGPPGPGAHQETKAETSVNYELGTDFAVGPAQLQLIGFYSDYDNILGAATLSSGGDGSGQLYNGGAVEVLGLEAVVESDLAAGARFGRVPARLAYTWTRAEFRTGFQSSYSPWGAVEPGDRLPYLPDHQLHGSVGLDRDAWQLRLATVYSAAMRTVAGQGDLDPVRSTDSFLVLNLLAEYAATPRASVYGSVQNLTDERYVVARAPVGARPGLPRTVQVGVRVQGR